MQDFVEDTVNKSRFRWSSLRVTLARDENDWRDASLVYQFVLEAQAAGLWHSVIQQNYSWTDGK